MRKILMLLLLLVSSADAFALSCGNNIIYKGYTLDQVMQNCGQPTSQTSTFKYLSQELEYYKAHPGDSNNAKIIFFVRNNKVLNINVTANNATCQTMTQTGNNQVIQTTQLGATQNIQVSPGISNQVVTAGMQTTCLPGSLNATNTNLCGQIISVGDSAERVTGACGQAAMQRNSQNPSDMTTVTEMKYAANHMTLVFENNVLTEAYE